MKGAPLASSSSVDSALGGAGAGAGSSAATVTLDRLTSTVSSSSSVGGVGDDEEFGVVGLRPLLGRRGRGGANSGGVLHRVGHHQSKWQRTVQEQRRNIYDKRTMLN